jgi:hypothetical protein
MGTFWGPFCVPSAWRSGVWPLGIQSCPPEINICPNMFSCSSNTTAFIVFYITIKSCFLAVNQAVNLLLSCVILSRFRSRDRTPSRPTPRPKYTTLLGNNTNLETSYGTE